MENVSIYMCLCACVYVYIDTFVHIRVHIHSKSVLCVRKQVILNLELGAAMEVVGI